MADKIPRIAEFYKVSFSEYEKTYRERVDKNISDEALLKIYEDIKLPKRATTGSAGYDFYAPFEFTLDSMNEIYLPLGIRAKMELGWVLQLFPRSGLGSKYRLQLNNTTGIIDSDYFDAENEGHIMCTVANCSFDKEKVLKVKKGDGLLQGVFLQYGITLSDDDTTLNKRVGGFGSTDKQNL